MKKWFYLLFVTVFFLSYTGCSDDDVDDGSFPSQKEDIILGNKGDSTLVLDNDELEKTVAFKALKPWVAEVSETGKGWLEISRTSGEAGDNAIGIRLAPNETYESRTAQVVITSVMTRALDPEPALVISVTQAQKDALVLAGSSYEMDEKGGEIEVELGHNVDFEILISEKDAAWISRKSTKAYVKEKIVFQIAGNTGYDSREGKITFVSKDKVLKQEVKVYQADKKGMLVTPREKNFDAGENTFEVVVKANVRFRVEELKESWIHRVETKGLTENRLNFRIDANEEVEARKGFICITDEVNSRTDTVKVTQMQKDALVVAKASYEVVQQGGEIEMEVGHNVDFDVTVPETCKWISRKQTKAYVMDKLVFVVATNDSYDSRKGTVLFESKDKSLKQEVEIVQEGKKGIVVEPETFDFDAGQHSFEITVKANVEFKVEELKEKWIHKVATKGLTENRLKFSIDANEGVEAREGLICITDLVNKVTDTVKVTQMQKDALVVGNGEISLDRKAQTFEIKVGHNVVYDVKIPDDCTWLSQVKTKAYTEDILKFQVSENTSVGSRVCRILFQETGEEAGVAPLNQTVEVVQRGKDEKLDITLLKNEFFFGEVLLQTADSIVLEANSLKNVFGIEVKADNKYRVEVAADKLQPGNYPEGGHTDWFYVDNPEPSKEDPMVFVHSFYMDYNEPNGDIFTNPIERTAVVRFISESGEKVKVLKVTQIPPVKVEMVRSEYVAEIEGGLVPVSFRTNSRHPDRFDLELDMVDMEPWARWNPSDKKKAGPMNEIETFIEVDPNPELEERRTSFRISLGNVSARAELYQKGRTGVKADKDSIRISSLEQEISFNLKANCDYTVEVPAGGWLHDATPPQAGKDPGKEPGKDLGKEPGKEMTYRTHTFKADANAGSEGRKAEITVRYGSGSTKITVVQDPKGEMAVEGGEEKSVDSAGGELEIALAHNTEYDVDIDVDWITPVVTRAMVTDRLKFQVQENKGAARTGTITFTVRGDETVFKEVKVVQQKFMDPKEKEIRRILARLYDDTDGPNWVYNQNWKTDAPLNEWVGVQYQSTSFGKFLTLDLSGYGLKNVADLSGCPDLSTLHLSYNYELKGLKADKCGKLAVVRMDDCGKAVSVKLDSCPNLMEVYCKNSHALSVSDILNLRPANKLDLTGCRQFTELDLSVFVPNDELLCDEMPNLTSIKLKDGASLQKFRTQRCPKLSSIDLGVGTSIYLAYLEYSPVSSLTWKDCTVTELKLNGAKLTSIDFTIPSDVTNAYLEKCMELTRINATNSQLQKLHVFEAPVLADFSIVGSAYLKDLAVYTTRVGRLDLTGCSELNNLNFSTSQLTDITLPKCNKLEYVYLNSNKLERLDLTGENRLLSLSLNQNSVSELDVSALSRMTTFHAESNRLSSVDLSASPDILDIDVDSNRLTSFRLPADRSKIWEIHVGSNRLQSLDVSGAKALTDLDASDNPLTSVNLKEVCCSRLLALDKTELVEVDLSVLTATNISLVRLSDNRLMTTLKLPQKIDRLIARNNPEFSMEITPEVDKQVSIKDVDWKYQYDRNKPRKDSNGNRIYDADGWPLYEYQIRSYGWWKPGEPDRYNRQGQN